MMKKTIKTASLFIFPLIMIATIYYYSSLRSTFYAGRTQYLAGINPVLVAIDPNGQPWVLDNPNNGERLRTLQADKWITSNSYYGWASSIVFDKAGNMWISDGQNGLFKIDAEKRTAFKTGNSGLASDAVYYLAIDNLDRLWMTYNYGGGLPLPASGVTMFNGTTWTTFTDKNSGLVFNEVTTIAFDAENRAWFGTTHGISSYDGNRWVIYSSSNSKLAGNEVWAIAFDKNDRAWIETANGINIFDGKAWVHYSFEEVGSRGHSSQIGSEIFIDPSKRMWIQNNGEVRIFDGRRWIGFAEEDGYNNNIGSLASDKQGNIWIANGNSRGLITLNSQYALISAWQSQPQRIFLSSGGLWYIGFILICLCIAILRNTVVPVALALLSGIAVTIGWIVIFNDSHVFFSFPVPIGNPGLYATVGATIGAAVRAGTSNRLRFVAIGLVVGLAIGICPLIPGMFAQ